jgi:hypothetical protein
MVSENCHLRPEGRYSLIHTLRYRLKQRFPTNRQIKDKFFVAMRYKLVPGDVYVHTVVDTHTQHT